MYYVGSTNDITRRINEHQCGKNKSTKNKRPVTLLHVQQFNSLSYARTVELWIKQQKSTRIVELFMKGEIKKHQGKTIDISQFVSCGISSTG